MNSVTGKSLNRITIPPTLLPCLFSCPFYSVVLDHLAPFSAYACNPVHVSLIQVLRFYFLCASYTCGTQTHPAAFMMHVVTRQSPVESADNSIVFSFQGPIGLDGKPVSSEP